MKENFIFSINYCPSKILLKPHKMISKMKNTYKLPMRMSQLLKRCEDFFKRSKNFLKKYKLSLKKQKLP